MELVNNPVDVLNIVKSTIYHLNDTNLNNMVPKIIALQVETDELLEEIADLIYTKALTKDKFTVTYAQLCACMINDSAFNKLENSNITFQKILAQKCSVVFNSDKIYQQDLEKLKKNIKTSSQTLTKSITLLCHFQFDYNNKVLSNCKFVCELFKQGAFPKTIILVCITELSKQKDELHMHCLCIILKSVGQKLSKTYNLDDIIQLILLFKNENNKIISSRLKMLILELSNLHSNDWIDKEQVQSPEKIFLIYQALPMKLKKEYELKSYYIIAEIMFEECHDNLLNFVNKKVVNEVTHLLTNTWIQYEHVSFVVTMVLVAINENQIIRFGAGKLLDFLLSKKLLLKNSVTIGVSKVLNDFGIKTDFSNLPDLVSDITSEFKFN